ncbi:unnamed protein product [Larinioides sclopetarius]|uniref:protein-tyrosine-phosphatase n=1 Tax=Larinioides sclopetarius TaxID=280406 RepID=A0AAV2A5E0_9ARAC
MTGTFVISSILFLFAAAFLSHTEADTLWSTESDAEEEEEKKQNILFGNGSVGSTLLPDESPTTKPSSLDRLIALDENALWNRPVNISDYDELHEEGKHDASPENSVDKDPIENVNDFLSDNPITESSVHLEDQNEPLAVESSNHMEVLELSSSMDSSIHLNVHPISSSISSKLLLLSNDSVSSFINTPNSEMVASLSSFNCALNDPRCKSSQIVNAEDLESKYKEEKFVSTTNPFLSLPSVWSIFKSLKSQDQIVSESSEIFMTSTETPTSVTVTPSPSESPVVLTSENIILIDEKDESVIQNEPNRNEKPKPVKPEDNPEELSSEQIFPKIATTPIIPHVKETASSDTRLLTSTLFTKLSEISSTSFIDLLSIEPSIAPTESEHTSSFQIPVSYYDDKEIELEKPFTDYVKVSEELSGTITSSFPTPTWYNSKSNIPSNKDKSTPVVTEAISKTTLLLSPSLQDSRKISSKIASLEPIVSSFSEHAEMSSVVTTVSSPGFSTPVLETNQYPVMKDSAASEIPREEVPPPRLTNPSCSSLPVCVEITLLDTTWETFCSQTYDFREFLSKSVSHYTRPIFPHHIVLDTEVCSRKSAVRTLQTSPDITISFYVTNDSGEYEERLTEICGVILRKWAPTAFRSSIIEVRLYNSESQSTPMPLIPELNSGFVAAVSISAVAGVALCLLCILLIIMKQKLLQGRNSETATPTADAYSLDSLSINASFRRRRNRRSARSYLNHAFNDQEIPSHPLNEKTLANCLKSRDLLEEEFKKIPMNMPKLDSIPEGAHVKNRYSNILPRPESRVVLAEPSGDPLKCYINANFIKGYEGKSAFYIACQAPLPEGIEDFWRMVWEQQSRVIIMLTMFEENGISRCAVYFPQSTLVSQQPYGDFQVSLVKKDVYEFYTISTLRLLDLEKNLFRDIAHLWFTGWPDVGVPKDPSSLITFVQQCRPFINCNSGPSVVHCSTGTGRTGVFLALDICMREYDESRSIDILQVISQLRRDRGGAVQNKDQYILIHEAMLEYISRVENQSHCPSICSKNS